MSRSSCLLMLTLFPVAVSAATLDPVGTDTSLLGQAATLQLDTLASQMVSGTRERAVIFHDQRRLDTEQKDSALPLHDARMTVRMTGVHALASEGIRVGLMFSHLRSDATFDSPDDDLDSRGVGLTAFLRTDYKGLMIDTSAGLTQATSSLRGGDSAAAFAVEADRYVRFVRLEGSYDFGKEGWTYGPFAGVDGIDIESRSAEGQGGSLDDDRESFTRYRMGAHIRRAFNTGGWTITPGLRALWFSHQDNEATAPEGEFDNGSRFIPLSDERSGTHPTAELSLTAQAAGGLILRTGAWSAINDDQRRQTVLSASIAHRF